MLVLFEKMALLVIILAIGYICAKIKLVGPEFNKGLSKMVINVFLAGMILASVMNKELSMSKGDMLFGIAMLFVMQIVCFAVGMITPAAMRIKDGDNGMYKLITSFSNLSFMGVPVISAVYGEGAIFFASLGNISFNVLLYTVIFLFEIPMPVIVVDVADMLSDACAPLSMMCIGLSLGSVSIKDAFVHPRIYGINFMRLIVAPVVVWLVLKLFVSDIVMLGSIVIIAACPPAIICAITAATVSKPRKRFLSVRCFRCSQYRCWSRSSD